MMLVLVLYMAFILSFVFRITLSELVADDYYSQEIQYQSVIDSKKNYNSLKNKPIITSINNEIKIIFPLEFNVKNINKGTIELFRPSDAKRDTKFPILLDDNNIQRIPTLNLLKGKYYFILDWLTGNKRYYFKTKLKV